MLAIVLKKSFRLNKDTLPCTDGLTWKSVFLEQNMTVRRECCAEDHMHCAQNACASEP